jgi:hypothetical protein
MANYEVCGERKIKARTGICVPNGPMVCSDPSGHLRCRDELTMQSKPTMRLPVSHVKITAVRLLVTKSRMAPR